MLSSCPCWASTSPPAVTIHIIPDYMSKRLQKKSMEALDDTQASLFCTSFETPGRHLPPMHHLNRLVHLHHQLLLPCMPRLGACEAGLEPGYHAREITFRQGDMPHQSVKWPTRGERWSTQIHQPPSCARACCWRYMNGGHDKLKFVLNSVRHLSI